MKRITIRLTEQDAEKLEQMCEQRGLQMSEAVRSLLRDNDDQKTIITELQKVQSAIFAMQKSNGSGAESAGAKSAESRIAEEALTTLLDLVARNCLITMKLAEQQFGEHFMMSADAIARKNADELVRTGKATLKAAIG